MYRDKNLFGEFAKSNAIFALLFPFFAAVSNLFFLAEINAISDMEKTPFNSIRKNIISISMFFFSPDGSEKPAAYKTYFS